MGCRVCGGAIDRSAQVREMLFGTRQPFEYEHCVACGCWQIATEPADMAPHYPPGYQTHPTPAALRVVPGWRRWLQHCRTRHELHGRPGLGALLAWLRGPLAFGQEWLRGFGLDLHSRILEFGCGDGGRMRMLRDLGFRQLTGQDAYSVDAIRDRAGIHWTALPLAGLEGPYDWIEAHHAFEHFPAPRQQLSELRRLLKPGGGLLLRVPLCDSHAAQQYGLDWVQWDAPRHFYLHTRRSLVELAARCGFTLRRCIEDGGRFSFFGSWLYRQDIAWNDPRVRHDGPSELCPAALWAQFQREAEAANAGGRSDQAAFVFVRD